MPPNPEVKPSPFRSYVRKLSNERTEPLQPEGPAQNLHEAPSEAEVPLEGADQ